MKQRKICQKFLKWQREEIYELKDQMFEVTDKLGIDFESEEEDDDL